MKKKIKDGSFLEGIMYFTKSYQDAYATVVGLRSWIAAHTELYDFF